ncbi:MAG: TSUP family transporter [Deltaproteobacteria bacterium]|nr:TSUP family transporter [Deltaproteobacteria bacterium]
MKTFLLSSIIALAATAQAVTGFGGNVVALSLGVHLEDLRVLVAAVILTGPLQTAPIVWLDRKEIRARLFLTRLLPLALLGLGVGLWLSPRIPTTGLSTLLGVLVIAFSARELWRTLRRQAPAAPFPPLVEASLYLIGGLVHGLIATGGPIIVYALARQLTDKRSLRGTLASLWLVLNFLMIAVLVPRLEAPMEAITLGAWLLPGLAVGFGLGQWLHHRVPERTFRLALFGLLLLAGLAALR